MSSFIGIVLPFIGGLGLFIYGMQIMSSGLENAAGSKMKKLLEVLTKNKILGVLLGTFITAIIQSSSATTVMVVGFVNAGIMNLTQAMSVIMGANIGTTVTGWIVSSSEWAKFLSPTTLAPLAVIVGVLIHMLAKKNNTKNIGDIIIGFGILFVGISTMSSAVSPLRESQSFKDLFVSLGSNPILGILAGAIVTAIIQSSSASVGILQTLAAAGLVPFSAAVYIIMGQNIGTCVTAILSSIGAKKNAKTAAYMHLLFNIVGSIIFAIIAIAYFKIINTTIGSGIISQTQISLVHTTFNIVTTVLLFPFSNYIILLATKINRMKDKTEVTTGQLMHLDYRMMETPSIAVETAFDEVIRMSEIVETGIKDSISTITSKNSITIENVFEQEETIDKFSNELTSYLLELTNRSLTQKEHAYVMAYMQIIVDVERISDYTEKIAEQTRHMLEEGITFSKDAIAELQSMIQLVENSYENAVNSLKINDKTVAESVISAEQEADDLEDALRIKHMHRLANQQCDVEKGIVYLELITNLERITNRAKNIAKFVIKDYNQA